MRRARGVTLIELLTTLGIVAILGSIATPSFTTLIRDTQRTTSVNAFLHAIYLARSAAIRGGSTVSLCKSKDGATCATTAARWQDGWIVFENTDRDSPPVRDAGEDVLLVNQGWEHGTINSNRDSYTFRAYTQAVVNGTIVFCDERGSEHARAIIISHTGRARVARRDASNRPLRCS